MDFGLAVLRAERVEALLCGARQPATGQDKLVLDTVATLHAWPPPTMHPDFRAALRTRLLAESFDAVSPGAAGETVTAPSAPGRATRPRHASGRAAAKRARAGGGGAAGQPPRHWVGRLARPALVGALASSVAAAGVTLGARDAMPGDTLYGIKRHVEQMQVTLAGGEEAQAEARLGLARARMDEVQALVGDHSAPVDEGQLTRLLEAWLTEVHRSSDVLLEMARGGDADVLSKLEEFTTEQSAKLTGVLNALPGDTQLPQATAAVHACIDQVNTLRRIAAESPSAPAVPPGQPEPPARGGSDPAPTPGSLASSPAAPLSPPSLSPTPPHSQAPEVPPGIVPTFVPGLPVPSDGPAPVSPVPTTPGHTAEPTPSGSSPPGLAGG